MFHNRLSDGGFVPLNYLIGQWFHVSMQMTAGLAMICSYALLAFHLCSASSVCMVVIHNASCQSEGPVNV